MSLPPEQEAFLDQIVDTLCHRGLQMPALIALEAGQPLSFLGGQLLWMAQPALSLFLSTQMVREVARLLENPTAVQMLIERLDTYKA
jgi:hypothetical protein